MGVLRAGEDAKTLELPLGDGVLLQHAADGKTHGQVGLLLHQGLVLGFLQSAGITGVGTIVLLLQLLAGEDCVLGVDDDDVVTAVNMRGVIGLELAAKKIGGEGCRLAHGLAGGVDHVPLAGSCGLLLGQKGSVQQVHRRARQERQQRRQR